MPTNSISSITRFSKASRFICGSWILIASSICFPMVIVGFNAVIGSWNTMEKSVPRSFAMSRSLYPVISIPFARIFPDFILAFPGSIFIRLLHNTLFPQPDSPTIARTSPSFRERLTFLTACTSPASVSKLTDKFEASNIVVLLFSSIMSSFCRPRQLFSSSQSSILQHSRKFRHHDVP